MKKIEITEEYIDILLDILGELHKDIVANRKLKVIRKITFLIGYIGALKKLLNK